MKFLRLIAVWLLLAALPLQGMAAFTTLMTCASQHADAVAVADHHGAQHTHEHSPDQQHDGSQPETASGHFCCHHLFSAAASGINADPGEAPSTLVPGISLLATLFIPELPQRPPRA